MQHVQFVEEARRGEVASPQGVETPEHGERSAVGPAPPIIVSAAPPGEVEARPGRLACVPQAGQAAIQARDPRLGEGAPPETELPRLIESLLFVAASPIPISQLAQTLYISETAVETALSELSTAYTTGTRGLSVQRKGDHVQLTTAAEAAPYIERFLGLDLTTRLSPAAMEALAVIAYRQPLTRPQIEAIRGVNCDGVLRTLLTRGLIEPVGRLEQVGRPFLYGTTFQFLQYFGLESLDKLPPLPDPGT